MSITMFTSVFTFLLKIIYKWGIAIVKEKRGNLILTEDRNH